MAKSNYINFTKRAIDQLPIPEKAGTQLRFFDESVRGLYVLVSTGGTKTFYARRKIQGKSERFCIGRHPDISVEQARTRAQEFQSKLAFGQNLAEVRKEQNKEMTLGELCDLYIDKHLKKKAKRWQDIEAVFRRSFSHWKSRRLSTIGAQEVLEIHQEIADARSEVTANRAVEVLRAMYNKAIKWRIYYGENPATIVTMFPEKIRSRVLEEHELEKFFAAVEAEPEYRDFFLLALQTGARQSNVFSMRWEDINFDTSTWTIPQEKTKTGEEYRIALTSADITILKERTKGTSPFVFPSDSARGHLIDPKKAWKRVLKRAGISDLRMHDLRRTMATWMANSGANAALIQGALNHKDIKTTLMVYAHSAKNAERDAKERAQQSVRKKSKSVNNNVVDFLRKKAT